MFIAALAAVAALQTATPAPAGPALHNYGSPTLAPDDSLIATVEAGTAVGSVANVHGVLTLRETTGKIITTVDPCATCRYGDFAWSPDAKTLAFIASDMKAGTATLYAVSNVSGAWTPRIVTTVKGVAGRPRWSPDGSLIAMLAVPDAHKQVGATQAGAARVGEIGTASETDEQRIVTVPAAGGELTLVSASDTWVYEYDWTPDGKAFAATAAKGDGDNNWWVAKLETFARDGKETVVAAPAMQMNVPRVSADGKSILFVGGLMSDFGPVGGDVYSVPVSGGEPKDITPDAKISFTSLTVTKAGIIAGFISGGETGLARLDASKSGYGVITQGEVSPSGVSLDATGKHAAAVVESFTKAPSLTFGPLDAMAAIAHDNDALSVPFTAKSITWQNAGFSVQGWLLMPANADPATKHPMITVVHGGPSSAVTPRFSAAGQTYELLKAGYFVFEPNPRGSYGQGEAFVQSNKRDFGGGDLNDIMTGIDAVEKAAPVDEQRLGIMGHSYGGLMTMWTVTHSTRFKAAVAGAGIANWSSYYGENGIDQWMIPFFGASFYDDPAIYDKLSPIRYIKAAKTPTFIYVGERDVECPAAQSLEFWHGLKEMGVDTSLVIYEGEGHGIRKPEHIADENTRIIGWFDKYLGGK